MNRRFFLVTMKLWFEKTGRSRIVTAVAKSLEALGHEVTITNMDLDTGSLTNLDVLFFFDMKTLKVARKSWRMRATVVLYNMEPVEDLPRYELKFAIRIRECMSRIREVRPDIIFDYNVPTTEFLKKQGFKSYHLPIAYHESYELPESDNPFLPIAHSLGEPRERDLRLEGKPQVIVSSRRGKVCESVRAAGLPCESYVFRDRPEEVDRLNVSPGVHLNIHQVDAPFTFGGIRVVVMGMSNARFILSEPCNWQPKGLKALVHWDVVEFERFPKRVRYWLDRPDECRQIGEAGRDFVRRHHRLDENLSRVLEESGI